MSSSKFFRRLFSPKSAIFSTNRESTTQFDDFRFP